MNVLRVTLISGSFSSCWSSVHVRCISQLKHHDGASLWKSVRADTGKAGGRGKRTKKRATIDLGRGKILGEGKGGYMWPGLNAPYGQKIKKRTDEQQAAWEEKREQSKKSFTRKFKIPGHLRGWSGGQWGGQKLIPDVDDEYTSKFDGYLLDAARVSHMRGGVGRVYSLRALVVVGNKNGTFGIGWHSADNVPNAARKARVKALKRLQHIERYEDRTIFEDMYVNHHRTFMHLRQQAEGYGLRCHRIIKTMCNVIGIKDLYVNTDGATTALSVVKCFVKALYAQETHQQKADRLGYHIVQYDPLSDNFPTVLASPKNGTKIEPYDEYKEYLNKPLITKVVRRSEDLCTHQWLNILYANSQGPPIPNQSEVPDVLRKIKDASL